MSCEGGRRTGGTEAAAGGCSVPECTLCITNVQRYSLHDGGGIRTVAFVKGCPFTCPWCCNPENLSAAPEVLFHASLCIGCAARADGSRDASGCPCDTDPADCPTGAKELMGADVPVGELAARLLRDRVFFEESGGGITVSGGECLAGAARQRAVMGLLERCGDAGVPCAVETTLAVPLEDAERLVRACDLFLVDFKIADRARSRELLGINVELRDRNIERLRELGARVIARMPIVPGYTDGAENVRANARRARELGIERADILPFHQLGSGKYDALGRAYACSSLPQLGEDDVAAAVRICEEEGLRVVVSGE